jgi:hypothetical protein
MPALNKVGWAYSPTVFIFRAINGGRVRPPCIAVGGRPPRGTGLPPGVFSTARKGGATSHVVRASANPLPALRAGPAFVSGEIVSAVADASSAPPRRPPGLPLPVFFSEHGVGRPADDRRQRECVQGHERPLGRAKRSRKQPGDCESEDDALRPIHRLIIPDQPQSGDIVSRCLGRINRP